MPVPPFEVGLYTSTLQLVRQAVAADGTITPVAGTYSLLGTIESVRLSGRNRTVNLSPMTMRQENNMVVESGVTMTFSGLILRSGTNGPRLTAFTADYVVATWAEGACGWTFLGLVESYDQDVSKERATYTLTLRHVSDTTTPGGSYLYSNPVLSGTV